MKNSGSTPSKIRLFAKRTHSISDKKNGQIVGYRFTWNNAEFDDLYICQPNGIQVLIVPLVTEQHTETDPITRSLPYVK